LRIAGEKRFGAETARAALRIQRQEVIKMKRLFASVSGALSTCTLALPAMAQGFEQGWPQPTNYNYHPTGCPTGYVDNHPYVADFNHYFDEHPEIRQQLSADPRLIDDPNYLGSHPGLREYMWAHPRVADSFREHPNGFVRDEHVMNHLRWDRVHHRWCR
jgi:hypothetical protein